MYVCSKCFQLYVKNQNLDTMLKYKSCKFFLLKNKLIINFFLNNYLKKKIQVNLLYYKYIIIVLYEISLILHSKFQFFYAILLINLNIELIYVTNTRVQFIQIFVCMYIYIYNFKGSQGKKGKENTQVDLISIM